MRHRRPLAAALVAAAFLLGLRAVVPPPPPSIEALVAAHDLDAGVRLTSADLRVVRVARSLAPITGALAESTAVGRVLAAPVRAGEVLTDRSVVGPSMLAGYPDGTVATAIRLPDAEIAALLHAGDHIDVYSAVAEIGEPAVLVASDLVVVAAVEPADEVRQAGAVVVLAATPEQAARLAGAAGTRALALDIRP
jgi:Flp pilus assembly protein CpaB